MKSQILTKKTYNFGIVACVRIKLVNFFEWRREVCSSLYKWREENRVYLVSIGSIIQSFCLWEFINPRFPYNYSLWWLSHQYSNRKTHFRSNNFFGTNLKKIKTKTKVRLNCGDWWTEKKEVTPRDTFVTLLFAPFYMQYNKWHHSFTFTFPVHDEWSPSIAIDVAGIDKMQTDVTMIFVYKNTEVTW